VQSDHEVEIECQIRINKPTWATIAIATGKIILRDGAPYEKWTWLKRKHVISISPGMVRIPRWLAINKGLIEGGDDA